MERMILMNKMKTLSKKNPYYISTEKKLELVHFCRQYPEWRVEYNELLHSGESRFMAMDVVKVLRGLRPRPTEGTALRAVQLAERMDLVDRAAIEAGIGFIGAIRQGAIYGKSYDQMAALDPMPVSRAEYYKALRKFYWLLAQKR